MGFNPLKKIKKAAKKVLKSPLGKIAAAYATYKLAPYMWGSEAGGAGGWGGGWEKFGPKWLYDAGQAGSRVGQPFIPYKPPSGILAKGVGYAQQHPYITAGAATAGLGYASGALDEDDVPEELIDDSGQQQYLSNRALYEDEWADWLVDMGKAADKTEALEMVRANPMFSEGGRVKAQGGLFAGQMPGRHPGMNQMQNPNMNPMGQGLGAPNLGPRSMGMTPGMTPGRGQDPRMAQLMQGQRRPSRPIPKESEDTELIQLIKMLTTLGIPMEQLRGRTKEELVEMLVSVKGKMGGQERPEVEEEVVEEEVVRAAHGGRIGLTGGQLVKPGPGRQGYGGPQDWGQEAAAKEHGSANVPDSNPYSDVAQRETRDLNQRIADNRSVNIPDTKPKDGITQKIGNWYKNNIYDRSDHDFKARQNFLFNQGLYQGNLGVYWDGDDENAFEDPRYNDYDWVTSPEGLKHFQGMGYTGGISDVNTGGGGGGGASYTNQFGGGAGTGTTTPSGDDYYKFAEWDKWLMPGETATQPMMPGGYKKEILANTGGLMRTGYAMGTEHPVIPSKDGKQLDMRDQGGYQPHGKAEKHDDVRALLAQGEFVMTSDAVKGMGGGDREVGAKKMYNLMHNMEAMA